VTWMSLVVLLAALFQSTVVPVRLLEKGSDSQLDDGQQATVRSVAEWTALWTRHAGERPRPAVNFARDMVVGVFLGSRPTAGFDVEIVGAREEGDALVVQYRETRPAAGNVTAQVLTSPYHLVAVPKHARVTFEKVS
jgi:PrcB C-terminal